MSMKIYTGGSFDLLHEGHLGFLRKCRALGSPLVVGLNRDEFIWRFKGRLPQKKYEHRADDLRLTGLVDTVVENRGDEDSTRTILSVGPDLIVIGHDWLTKDYFAQMGFSAEWLIENQIGIAYIPRTGTYSTTRIRQDLG